MCATAMGSRAESVQAARHCRQQPIPPLHAAHSHAGQVPLLAGAPDARRPQCAGAQAATAGQWGAVRGQHSPLRRRLGSGVGVVVALGVGEVGQRLVAALDHLPAEHHIAAGQQGAGVSPNTLLRGRPPLSSPPSPRPLSSLLINLLTRC